MKYNILLLLLLVMVTVYSHDEIKKNSMELNDSTILFSDKDEFEEIAIDMDNWSFSVDNVKLNSGKNYRLTFITKEGHHGVIIPDMKYDSGKLKVGESMSFDFKNVSDGKYVFYCNIPCGLGHRKMKGLIEVI